MRPLPPLNALRAFEAAGRHESFALAAGELNVAQSSISRHVRGLEDWLGVALFADLPRGVRLTEAGAAYLAEVSPALDRIADATDMLANRGEGVLTVSCEPIFAARWLVQRMGAFREHAPDVELRIDSTPDLADIRRYAADMAIRFYNSGVPDGPTDLISDTPMFPYAAPALAEKVRSLEDLLHLPRLQERGGDPWQAWFAKAGVETGEVVTLPAWTMRATLACELALAGEGVLLASGDVMIGYEAEGRLHKLSEIGLTRGSYHLVQSDTARRNRAARTFRTWLLDHTRDLRQVKSQPMG